MSPRVLAAGAAALVAAGCGGGPRDRAGPPRPPPDRAPTAAPSPRVTDGERLQDLLSARARALEEGRPAAYARTAVRARRPVDVLAARRAGSLGLRDVALTVEDVQTGGDRAWLQVRLSYRVRGVRGTFGAVRPVTARRVGATRWRVAGRPPPRGRAPWEADALRRLRTPHFVVWLPEDVDPRPLAEALEDGYARMLETLEPGSLRRRYLAVVARDAAAARRMTKRIGGLDTLTALTDTEVRQRGPAKRVVGVASQRLLVVLSNFVPLDPESQRIIVAHELTHAALAPDTSGRTPGWLTEGVAMYVSGDRRSTEAAELLDARVAGGLTARRALSLRALSAPDSVGRLAGTAQRAAYAYASAAAFHIAERHGRERLVALYDAFNRVRLRGRSGDPALTDAALRRVLGVSLAAFERDLRASLTAGAAP